MSYFWLANMEKLDQMNKREAEVDNYIAQKQSQIRKLENLLSEFNGTKDDMATYLCEQLIFELETCIFKKTDKAK